MNHSNSSLLLLIASLVLGACASQPQAAAPPPVAVQLGRVQSSDVRDSTEFNAKVEGVENAIIKPRVSGWVKQVYVRLGDQVSQGQPLLQIDAAQQQANFEGSLASVASRQAQLNSAIANLDAQRAELRRIQAELVYQSQEADLLEAQDNLEAEKQEKQRLQFELEFISEADNLKTAEANLQAALKERDRRVAVKEERQKTYERYKNLFEQGVVSAELYDEKQLNLESADAELATQEREILSLRAQVGSARQDLDRQITTLEAQIASQENRISAAQARVKGAEQALERQVSTLEAQIASQEKVIVAQQADVDRLRREINQAQAGATAEQVQLGYYEINAPISGIVGNLNVKVGDNVDSQTTLTSIRQNDVLEVSINIPVERLSQIRNGTLVELLSQETGELIGSSRVSFISPDAGSQTQAILVKAIYNNQDNKLRTDQIVRARVIWEQQPGLTIPTSAISRIGNQSFVFVAQPENKDGQQKLIAKQRPVKLGSIQGQSYQVLSGLKAGEQVVTDGVVKLRDGVAILDSGF